MKPASQHDTHIPNIWAWPNLIGLDSPIAAICWQAMFARISGVDLPWFIHLILGFSTWCIYLADRISDVIRAPQPALTSRHRFTQNHFRKLISLLIIISICNLALISRFLPHKLLIYGITTLGLVGIYYLIRFTRLRKIITLIPREIICGMLFSIGCTIAPYAYASNAWNQNPTLFIPVIMFGCVCSVSCILISAWEKEADFLSADPSIATTHSYFIPHLATTLTSLAAVSFGLAFIFHWQAMISITTSTIALGYALRNENRISPLNLRILADAVLLSPLIFIGF